MVLGELVVVALVRVLVIAGSVFGVLIMALVLCGLVIAALVIAGLVIAALMIDASDVRRHGLVIAALVAVLVVALVAKTGVFVLV